MGRKIKWHEMTFPPINLWNVPITKYKEESMGVDYRPVLAIGVEMDSAGECVDFLSHLLREDELQALEEEGDSFISEITYDNDDLPTVECLNLFTGCGWYVGFKLSVRDVEQFYENVGIAKMKWDGMFPDVPATIIHTVRVS